MCVAGVQLWSIISEVCKSNKGVGAALLNTVILSASEESIFCLKNQDSSLPLPIETLFQWVPVSLRMTVLKLLSVTL